MLPTVKNAHKNSPQPENPAQFANPASGTQTNRKDSTPSARERPASPATNTAMNNNRITDQAPDRSGLKPATPLSAAPTENTPASSAGDVEDRVNTIVADIASGTTTPATGTDFSTATPEELGDAAANAAEEIGGLIGQGNEADLSQPQGTIAAVRGTLAANGATDAQLQQFDASITVLATESALVTSGNPLGDTLALQQSRFTLQATTLEAFDGVRSGPNAGVHGRVSQLIGEVASGAYQPRNTPIFAGSSTDGITTLLSSAVVLFVETARSALPDQSPSRRDLALSTYADTRNQLASDGATEAELQELDAFMIELITEKALDTEAATATPGSAIDREGAAFGALDFDQIDAIARTHIVRENRRDGNSLIDDDSARQAADVTRQALAYESEGNPEFEFIDTFSGDELSGLLNGASRDIAFGLFEGDEALVEQGLENFSYAFREASARAPNDNFLPMITNIFEERTALLLSNRKDSTPEKRDAIPRLRDDLRLAVGGSLTIDEASGIARVRSFEGKNGKDPVDVFVIEIKPIPGEVYDDEFADHSVDVAGVVDRQLREAGQSFNLYDVHQGDKIGGETTRAERRQAFSDALTLTSQHAARTGNPVYANLSLGFNVTPNSLKSGLEAVSGTELTDGLDLSVDITQENIGDYADAIRELAFASDQPEIAEMLGGNTRFWQDIKSLIIDMENAIKEDVHFFIAVPNSDENFSILQFAKDEGAKGTLTFVGSSGQNALESNEFFLPDQGETPPDIPLVLEDGSDAPPSEAYYRGDLVDVFAPGFAFETFGSSFATPDMLVNAVLGRFDPETEMRTNSI